MLWDDASNLQPLTCNVQLGTFKFLRERETK
jgi:hypothetical protein